MSIDVNKIIGEKHNNLLILEAYRGEKSMIYCKCLCDCGNIKEHIRYYSLRDGVTTSCGCIGKEKAREANTKYKNLDDLIGIKFNRLTIINAVRKGKKSLIYCDCVCDCGNISKNIQLGSLKNNTVKSCGCLHDELSAKRLSKQRKDCNIYWDNEDYCVGLCNDGTEFIFDKEDYEKIKDYCWHKSFDDFIVAYNPDEKNHIYLHKFVMNCPENLQVDHIHHNRLDNRKSELRICTNTENLWNRRVTNKSGHKGVFENKDGTYTVKVNKKNIGKFNNFKEACIAEEKKEIEEYGEFSIYFEKYKNIT